MMKVMELTAALAKSIKHVSFHPSGNLISTVDTNGSIRIYSLSTEKPTIIETLSGIVPIVHSPESPESAKVAWHPDGSCFAAPSSTREIAVYDRVDWKKHVAFGSSKGHLGPITDICWSPNGAYLASCAQDKTILIWESKSQALVKKMEIPLYALQVVWHPNKNILSWTTNDGELFSQEDIVPLNAASPCDRPIHRSPISTEPSVVKNGMNGTNRTHGTKQRSRGNDNTRDENMSEEDAIQDDLEDAGAEWIEDDDGAGYIPNLQNRGKRPAEHGIDTEALGRGPKRGKAYAPSAELHEKVQPGSTPWRSGRRYLTLNMIGWVWTVEQDDHNTVTVEFHDREAHRQYHFTDSELFSLASLDDVGALFAAPTRVEDGEKLPATLHYRPHESWAAYSNWSVKLPAGEDVEAIALSHSSVVVCTSKGYMRIYTLHGLPKRVLQIKSAPIVAAIARGNYVMVVANGPAKADGAVQLVYSIYHTQRDDVIQNDDLVALPPLSALKSLFFGEDGNPYIYSSNGLLSVLLKWKTFGQAQWLPVLETNLLQRRAGKDESYWPVAVADNKFHCIILKGADRHPHFPRPITSEFDFLVPITTPDYRDKSQASLEIALAQDSVLSSLAEEAEDLDENARLEAMVDRNLLQLLNLACKNEQDARALDICESLRRTTSLDAAVKIAGHHNRINLAERIGRISSEE